MSPTRKWASFRSCVRMKLCGRVRERFASCWDGRTQDSLRRSFWPRVLSSINSPGVLRKSEIFDQLFKSSKGFEEIDKIRSTVQAKGFKEIGGI